MQVGLIEMRTDILPN